MKKIIHLLIAGLLTSTVSIAQDQPAYGLNYTDLGVLFSDENPLGTSRFSALNGAMGAIGGDLSAINVNPAGAAVFNSGEFNFTLGVNNYDNQSNYYNSKTNNTSSVFNFEQIGVVFVFKDQYSNNGWNKISFSANYQLTNKFDKSDIYRGNSGYGSFITHPNDDASNLYDNAQSQQLYNFYEGEASKLSFTLAGEFNKKLYLGGSLNFHSIDFFQSSKLDEISTDDTGNTLATSVLNDNRQNSEGFSLTTGIIYKPNSTIRLGFSAETPTWFYNVTEEYFYVEEFLDNEKGVGFTNSSPIDSFYEYRLRTPGKITVSSAFVIGKRGFINIDYNRKGYKALNLSGEDEFVEDNQYYKDVLKNTNNVNIGAEFKLGNISLRGGAGFQESPFKDSVDPRTIDVVKTGDRISASLGIGARFGNSKIDLAYRMSEQTNEFDFNDVNQASFIRDNPGQYLGATKIENNNSSFGITYTYLF